MVQYYKSGVGQENGYTFPRNADVVQICPPDLASFSSSTSYNFPLAGKVPEAFDIIADKIIKDDAKYLVAEVAAPGKNPDKITFHIRDGADKEFKSFLQSIEGILPRRGIPLGARGSFAAAARSRPPQPQTPAAVHQQPQARAPQALSYIGQQPWQMDVAPDGKMPIMRVQFGKDKEELAKAEELKKALSAQGINFMDGRIAEGPRVHVWGQEMDTVAAHWNWKHGAAGGGANYVGIPVKDRDEGQKKIEALKAMGIDSVLNDTKDGPAVCLRNIADSVRIQNARQKQGMPSIPSGQLEGPIRVPYKGPGAGR